MFLNYELAISCALAALVIMHIIHMRRKWLRLREQRRSIENQVNASRESAQTNLASLQKPPALNEERAELFYHRFIMLLLILALLWFAGRIWMEA